MPYQEHQHSILFVWPAWWTAGWSAATKAMPCRVRASTSARRIAFGTGPGAWSSLPSCAKPWEPA